jgi:arylsulfatase A-like enzyme
MVSRRTAIKTIVASTLSTSLSTAAMTRASRAQPVRPNIVLVICDDMNCAISPYAPTQRVFSPNFERLKDFGVMFENAYAAVPACAPSRTAIMLGVEPTTSGVFINSQNWQEAAPLGAPSLFGHFRALGWELFGTGKLFHLADRDLRASDWSDYWVPNGYFERLGEAGVKTAASADGHFDFGPSERAAAPDVECTDWAIGQIASGAFDRGGAFVALGLARPHLPFLVPQEWFDHYPEVVEVPAGYWPGSRTYDGNVPDQADLGRTGKRRTAKDKMAARLSEHGELNDFLRAYYASTSFADSQIGRVLDALEARDLWRNTIIVVTSDHGFMLGEKRQFSKFDVREVALKVPLFVAGAGIAPRRIAAPVSLVDLYPTLCGLAGVPVPGQCEGQDLAPAIRTGAPPPRDHAISCYGGRTREEGSNLETFKLHSSVRTPAWRLIDYGPAQNPIRRMMEFGAREVELYDHDPASPGYDPHEWHNLADERPEVVAELSAVLPPPATYQLPAENADTD